ncbi:hypothetical protein CBR_g36734 [Chara braunii]|uniref:Uncharacterized protein n=1 Tax=Chara braunii TaxID=69332 RepID=A0A388LLA6_CHABU|nr:hypothetical protein CBR_g36734 [Chara braunii]|eukprot:GBG83116.1 hypothetical protein CBR_g36734 [Chara braunii]
MTRNTSKEQVAPDQAATTTESGTRKGHNSKTFDSPFKIDAGMDAKRDDLVWHFVARCRYLYPETAVGRKSGRRCVCRLCGKSICGGSREAKEHFFKSKEFRCPAGTPAVYYTVWAKNMDKCPKDFVVSIEELKTLPPGAPAFQWSTLFPEDSEPRRSLASEAGPSRGAVSAPVLASVTGGPSAGAVPPPVLGGTAVPSTEATRPPPASLEGHHVSPSVGLHPMFTTTAWLWTPSSMGEWTLSTAEAAGMDRPVPRMARDLTSYDCGMGRRGHSRLSIPPCPDGGSTRTAGDEDVGLACPDGSLPRIGDMVGMGTQADSMFGADTIIPPSLPLVPPPSLQGGPARDATDRGFDEFGGDTILFAMASATPSVFRVGKPHEVALGLAETTTRHEGLPHTRDGRSSAQRSLADSLDGASSDSGVREGAPLGGLGGDPCVGAPSTTRGGEGRSGAPPTSASHAEPGKDITPASSATGRTRDRPAMRMDSAPHAAGRGGREERQGGAYAGGSSPPVPRLAASSFYDRGRAAPVDGGTAAVRSACGMPDVPFGTHSIGAVGGRNHGAMREYEDQHGRQLATKTSDVAFTRVVKASMSRAKSKGGHERSSQHSSRRGMVVYRRMDRQMMEAVHADCHACMAAPAAQGTSGATTPRGLVVERRDEVLSPLYTMTFLTSRPASRRGPTTQVTPIIDRMDLDLHAWSMDLDLHAWRMDHDQHAWRMDLILEDVDSDAGQHSMHRDI